MFVRSHIKEAQILFIEKTAKHKGNKETTTGKTLNLISRFLKRNIKLMGYFTGISHNDSLKKQLIEFNILEYIVLLPDTYKFIYIDMNL